MSWVFDSVANLGARRRLADVLGHQAVVPLVEVDDDARAVDLAHALVDNGLPAMEIALRTPGAMSALQAVRSSVGDAVVGVGTVLSSDQLASAVAAGAAFAVSPGSTAELLAAALGCPIPFLPGVATATELMHAVQAGMHEVKVFPAEPIGGVSAVAALSAVAPSARFMPTGGIDARSASAYLMLDRVFAVGGSWVCPKALIHDRSWGAIGNLARAASRLLRAEGP